MSGGRRDGPPRWHRRLLRRLVPRRDRTAAESELEELWRVRRARDGRAAADRWYRRQVGAFLLRGVAWRGRRSDEERAGPLDRIALDVRAAIRRLGRNPGSTAAALLALVLGIGAGTTVFGVVDGVVLRPLPFPAADRLVHVGEVMAETGMAMAVAPPAYLAWSGAELRTLEGVAATSTEGIDLVTDAGAEHLEVARVGATFFGVMGVPPALGRGFTTGEDAPGGPPAVVLSNDLWARRFGGDSGVVGRTIRLGGAPHRVVGVMPEGFDFPDGTEAWLPLGPALAGMEDVWGALFLRSVGRLREDATVEGARAELNAILDRHPDAERWNAGVSPLRDHLVGDVRRPLLLLFGAVGLVILVACANVGGLLLVQTTRRGPELAVRSALGAGRGRLSAALLTESVLLAGLAGALGVALGAAGLEAVRVLVPGDLPRGAEVGLDGRVVAFAALASLASGFLAGLVPALRLLRTNAPAPVGASADRRTSRAREVLVVGQVAVSVVLLAGAVLLGRSFLGLLTQDVGFEPEGLAAAELELPEHRYPDDTALDAAYDAFVSAAASVPGVEGAAVTRNLPLAGRSLGAPLSVDGETRTTATHVSASPGYLELLGIRRISGRTFDEADARSARPVVVVSESLAEALIPGEDPVGRTVRTMFGGEDLEIVGVVADVRHASPGTPPEPILYRPLRHWRSRGIHVVVRSDRPAAETLPALRAAILAAEPGQAVVEVASLDALRFRRIERPRFYTLLLGGFAVLALFLALLGLHGLLSSFVFERRREVGIRMALGADAGRVWRSVVMRSVGLVLIGVGLGLAGAGLAGRLLEGLLYGVRPGDPTSLLGVAGLMVLTAGLAAWPIARRATRVDPVTVMRV